MRANRGKAWEARLTLWHQDYRRDGRAIIFQTQPGMKTIRGRAVYTEKGPPDFIGVAHGMSVCFDAKECKQKRWPFSALADHQARDLEAHQNNGGISFIALRMDRPRILPWRDLGPMWWEWREGRAKRGEGSLSVLGVAGIGIPMDDDGWIGWLERL